MKRLYIITNPIPTHNASPVVSLGKFAAEVTAAGFDAYVIGARLPRDISDISDMPDSVKTHSFSYGGRGIAKALSYVLLQLRLFFFCLVRLRADTPVFFWLGDKMIGAFLAAKCRRSDISYFVYGRTDSDRSPGWAKKLLRFMMRHANHVCAEAPSVLADWGVEHGDVIPLYCPAPSEVIPYSEREHRICMLCRLVPEKHPLEAMRAAIRVLRDFPDWSLTVIGGGLLEDECRALADLAERINVTGWLTSDKVRQMLPEFRILLYPTDTEGVPGGVLEAMSAGVVPLVSPVGGIPDVVRGIGDVYLSGTSEDAIADSLRAAILRDDLADISQKAESRIRERYSIEGAAQNFKDIMDGRMHR